MSSVFVFPLGIKILSNKKKKMKEEIVHERPSHSEIESEWHRVKDVDSLYKYYPTRSDYMKWHNRFLRAGYIQKRPGGWTKLGRCKTVDRAKYSREWRIQNPGRASDHVLKYWTKKIRSF
jgi:hypothetical protein